MNYKELEKLYSVKIPVFDHVNYYLETLQKSSEYSDVQIWIKMLQDLESQTEDVTSYKFKQMDRIIADLKIHIPAILAHSNLPFVFESKGFKPESGHLYISLDIREANWSAFRALSGLEAPSFSQWLETQSVHQFLAQSKTFRQHIFGNLNPKKLIQWQQQTVNKMLASLTEFKVVGIASDEIIIDITEESKETLHKKLDVIDFTLFKAKKFKTEYFDNYGEHIRIDSIFKGELVDDNDVSYRKLVEVTGTRYFIHFKTLIIGETIDERDLLFKNDHKLAKWVL